MRRITHLRRVGITTPDTASLGRFYSEIWGLEQVAEQDGAVYLRGTGPEHHILAIYPGPRPSVRSLSLGLPDRDAVDEAYGELKGRRGVRVAGPPAPIGEPGGGYGFRIADLDGRALELSADVAPATGPAPAGAIQPGKISHVVLNTPEIGAFAELLTDVLGLRLSDETAAMQFFRCNADHHSVALARAPHGSLNHIAFEVRDTDEVLRGIDHMKGFGVDTIWGPGRHGPGHNVFGYFRAPNGQVIEYTADLQQITNDDEYVARFWEPSDYSIRDAWAAPDSLQPSPEAREAMRGEPESDVAPLAEGRRG